ncbi:hypothetical protein BJ912DRAFT_177613 [Pholiota molesta]|nr:hypothetical protein BJ912DRAFT_177613 [Pholiota molesta]
MSSLWLLVSMVHLVFLISYLFNFASAFLADKLHPNVSENISSRSLTSIQSCFFIGGHSYSDGGQFITGSRPLSMQRRRPTPSQKRALRRAEWTPLGFPRYVPRSYE